MNPMADIAAAMRVAAALDAWRRSTEISLEEALGRAPGCRAAWRLRRRDEALRRLALQFPDLSGRALATEVHRCVTRYRASAWRRDRDSGHRPDAGAGLAFDVLIHGELPGREHLRKAVLGDGNGSQSPTRAGMCRS